MAKLLILLYNANKIVVKAITITERNELTEADALVPPSSSSESTALTEVTSRLLTSTPDSVALNDPLEIATETALAAARPVEL